MQSGDIYAYKTPNDYYSIIRILRVTPSEEYQLLFYLTSYYDKELPQLDNKKLFSPYDEYSIIWVEKIDEKKIIKLDHKTLSEWENKCHLKPKIGFEDTLSMALNVPYYQWLEKYDLKAFENMLKIDQEEEKQQNQSEKELPSKLFWGIIGSLKFNNDKPLEEAKKKLAELIEKQIKQFEEALAHRLYKLDTRKHACEIGEHAYGEEYFSPDYFLYIRCYCVAMGKDFFETCLKHPQSMPKNAEEFEELLELADEALKEKIGVEMDYIPSKEYETFSNTQGWE